MGAPFGVAKEGKGKAKKKAFLKENDFIPKKKKKKKKKKTPDHLVPRNPEKKER